jgi:protein gp37
MQNLTGINESKIAEWTEKPWNPITGCSKVSSGCLNCYAEKLATTTFQRWKNPRYKNNFNITLHEDLLEAPFHWKKPQRVFTCSMSDLFHSDIPKDFLLQVFDTMKKCSQHTFLILTKRAERLTVLSPTIEWSENIWMGVTVEEDRFKDRIDELRTTGAKHKFISAEPLLSGLGSLNLTGIDWIFVGGESGENSRPIEEDWVLNIRDQCFDQGVMFTFKQWGGKNRKKNGSLLQGNYYHEMPPVMRD